MTFFLIKAAIAGPAMASHGEESCSPPFAYTPGAETVRGQTYVGYLAVVAVRDFLGQVLDYAKEYRRSEAGRRVHQQGTRDAVSSNPGGESTR